MLKFINKYRYSPERGYAIIGFKTFMRITKGRTDKSGLKTAFTELKTVKNGAYQCEKVFRVRICDLIAAGGIMVLCFIIKMKKNSYDDREEQIKKSL